MVSSTSSSRLLKKSARGVLATLRGSTYYREYASPPRLLRPCWTAFLNSLRWLLGGLRGSRPCSLLCSSRFSTPASPCFCILYGGRNRKPRFWLPGNYPNRILSPVRPDRYIAGLRTIFPPWYAPPSIGAAMPPNKITGQPPAQ